MICFDSFTSTHLHSGLISLIAQIIESKAVRSLLFNLRVKKKPLILEESFKPGT